ncbi:MAG: exopolysaccharide biosynthesis polyprenyl glycosylphosphotransferase, partial [Acholeplasmataceae bacterium]|nr:exopolysaccharide biosynthesis polyprenyl glycosylphosphotransferase [Acholeplasmataceae bacterium]
MAFSPMTIIAILFLQIAIFAVYKFIMHRLFSKVIMKKVMIIGPKREALALALKFHTDSDHNKEIHSIIFEINHQVSDDFYDLVHDIDDVYLTPSLSDNIKYSLMQYTIAKAYRNIYVVPKTHEISFMNAKDDSIDDILLLHLPAFGITHEQRFLKRSFDLIVSLLGLIILAPFFLIFSILIKLEDGGPIFFKQLRYKRHNKPFKVYKFRTMSVNQHADQINKRASINDNRITRVGKFLRATRFDELAQLINVVKSEMSIVGPRPLIIEEIEEAAREIPEFYFRSNVKPGLTGLAQIKGKYDTEASEKIRYDLLYVTKQSFWFDLKIIILTVRTIFTKGSVIQNDSKKTFQDFLKEKHISYIETENLIKIL